MVTQHRHSSKSNFWTGPFRQTACLGGAIICLVSISGCSPPAPTGQVVATVNGQEITVQDLEAEARAHNQGPRPPNATEIFAPYSIAGRSSGRMA